MILPIPGYPGYYASFTGLIYKGKTELSQFKRVRNYLGCTINRKPMLVHRLVLLAFKGLPKEKEEALHIDSNPTNNKASNLKWGCHRENMSMDRGNNHSHPSILNPMCKVALSDILQIRRSYRSGKRFWGRRELARKLGLSEQQIYRIAHRLYGGHI